MNARELALDVLLETEKNNAFGSSLIKNVLDKYDYEDPREKAFFKRLAEGTLERKITLDYYIDSVSKTPVRRMKPLIASLLRLSAYQILYMESVPDAAACNEAVKLAKKRGFTQLGGFVNGVLRALARSKENICWPDEEKEPVRSLSVQYSVPAWLTEKWMADYGIAQTREILAGMSKERPTVLRFRESLGADRIEAAVEDIRRTGVCIEPHSLLPYAFNVTACEGVAGLPGFAEGLFFVQDVSSMLAVEAAGIRPGMRVLDVCAAPGGKTLSAAEKLNGTGQLRARDITMEKVERILENAERMGYPMIEAKVLDARQTDESCLGWADVVLADLPCSGLGVAARKKEIRYRIEQEDLESLTRLQRQILDTVWQYVKPGGILLYSTCTMNPAENEKMADYLTRNYPFEAESLDPYLPGQLQDEKTAAGSCQLFLGKADTDGFFMARLRRKEE